MKDQERLYTPYSGELQLTFRAVFIGCLIGGIVTAMNIYVGLKVGWSFGGSLMAAILSFSFFQLFKSKMPFGVLETNIAQTAGSGAGSMASAAGLLAAIPALKLLGIEVPPFGLFVWALSTAFMGVMFAVPLRRQYVEIEKLKFPTGVATANTIVALYAEAEEALKKARVLIYGALFAFVVAILFHFFPAFEQPAIHEWFPSLALLTTLSLWGFSVLISPMMFGAGLIIGPKVGWSMVLGAIVGWGLGYIVQQMGIAPLENPMRIYDPATNAWGAKGWILWVGVAIMVSEALVSLAFSWRTFVSAFKSVPAVETNKLENQNKESIPNFWWVSGLIASSILIVFSAKFVFEIPYGLSIVAIVMSAILANVAVRSTGETDINPIGGMAKVTQGVFGMLSSSITTNLMSAGITGAGASQAADMMQDLKTGYMLNASPKKQFIAQLWGVIAGTLFSVPIYYLFDKAYNIGAEGSVLGAPAAYAWKSVAEVMIKGLDALPPFAPTGMWFGAALGTLFVLIKQFAPKLSAYVPSGLAFGISFLIPAYYAFAMFGGTLFYLWWTKKNPTQAENYVFPISCGLIAGEGMAGIANAILSLFGL